MYRLVTEEGEGEGGIRDQLVINFKVGIFGVGFLWPGEGVGET